MEDGNSNVRTYATTQWNQNTDVGTFPPTNTITTEINLQVQLGHSVAMVVHGDQHVTSGTNMYIYRDYENIYATFEMIIESTFTNVYTCEPGSSVSVFIGDITLM